MKLISFLLVASAYFLVCVLGKDTQRREQYNNDPDENIVDNTSSSNMWDSVG